MSALHIDGRLGAGAFEVAVALDVAAGETVAVLGPNGAGKTTLLQAVAGLRSLDDGEIRLGDRLLDAPQQARFVAPEERSIGVVFQELLLFPHLDVADNVAFGLRARGVPRRRAREEALGWLGRFGLAALASATVDRLSGGEAQRVALARALAPAPEALLLDEPLSALDADVRGEVRRELRDHLATHEGPCIVVTHDPLDAAVLADRVVVLEAGRVTATGSLDDLVARPRTTWAAELAGTNLLAATAAGSHLTLAGGGVVVAAEPVPSGPVLVAFRPAAVALHRQHPEGSPRNVWPGTVAEVEGFGERVRVRLAGPVPLVAEVTGAAVGELDLQVGTEVWASVKATEVLAYPT